MSPALFMPGRAPFRAESRLPPNGTYCWLGGKDSVFRSCRRCFSLRMEWTAFRKSFLVSGELQVGQSRKTVGKNKSSYLILCTLLNSNHTCSTVGRFSQVFLQIRTWCALSHTSPYLQSLKGGREESRSTFIKNILLISPINTFPFTSGSLGR